MVPNTLASKTFQKQLIICKTQLSSSVLIVLISSIRLKNFYLLIVFIYFTTRISRIESVGRFVTFLDVAFGIFQNTRSFITNSVKLKCDVFVLKLLKSLACNIVFSPFCSIIQ